MAEESVGVELEELRQAARVNNIYHANLRKFHRNANLSDVVHTLLHLSEFFIKMPEKLDKRQFTGELRRKIYMTGGRGGWNQASVLAVELFHHIHHAVNRLLREENPDIPDLPEERNPIFFGLPISMTASLLVAIIWPVFHGDTWKIQVAISACVIGGLFMLLSGIFAMRHAEKYINLEEIPDDELLRHPIFIHNFVLCILSIFALMLYLIHFWILFDCLRWDRKHRSENSSRFSTDTSAETTGESTASYNPRSSSSKSETSHHLTPIPTWDGLHFQSQATKHVNVQDEPIILYCCCIDLWRYLRHEKTQLQPTHEFQVIHIL